MVKQNVIIVAFISVSSVYCLVMVPERANVTEINEKYLNYAKLYITRRSRRSPYFMNVEGRNKHPWGNNVTGHFYFYEYLHNEYRRSFVEVHGRFCDVLQLQKERYRFVGKMLTDKGLCCPLPVGDHRLFNMTLPLHDFHYQMPFRKFRLVIELKVTDSDVLIAKAYLNGVFNNK